MVLFKPKNYGFSLIEILIVAVLLAIFASLAAINISEVFQQNRIKATYGELDSIRKSIGFASSDVGGIYPKLNFLNLDKEFILDSTSAVDQATPNFDYMGHNISGRASSIFQRWRGPYLGIARPEGDDADNPTVTRKAGVALMQISSNVFNTSNVSTDIVNWPIDVWSTPYVLYLIKIERDINSGITFIDFIQGAGERPNYAAAYVSYGPDRLPGGLTDNPTAAELARKDSQRLFEEAAVSDPYQWRALETDMYTTLRLQGYSEQKLGDPSLIGVIDIGSDDIVLR